MERVWKWILGSLGTLGAWLAYLLGGWDLAMQIMVLFMAADYVTGLVVALMCKSGKTESGGVSSNIAFLGVTKKLLMLMVIIVATALDRMIGTEGVYRFAAIGFYVANEGISVIENVALMGVPFPQSLLDVLHKIKDRNDTAQLPDGEEEKNRDDGRAPRL